ncbi:MULTISPECIES: DUF6440 family protein [Ruminococcus]|uniref:DUF6440 domain-containing protein n=1 Tax=Ruminococcus flavefaciens TaxID=1265 RepID=A0A1M7KWZ3_RUMFL|nr:MULTISPECIES: DUF6440 family protein [Ruminococcus]MCR4796807.1 DUF6440 family protein [Ruminococcus sp.]SHM70049.1 hypothetical protein SAMN04487860_11096 [Ruminococcus flavefaciens]
MFGKEKKTKRFIVTEEQAIGMGGLRILVDTQTGVNYLNTASEIYAGLTPLLDENGKVIVTPVSDTKE